MVDLLHAGAVSASELTALSLAQIADQDRNINAMPVVCADRALSQAKALDDAAAKGGERPLLGGLPTAIKELDDLQGVETTQCSPIHVGHVAARSDIFVANLEQNGAVPVGKSNSPEFGAGGNTFNEVFGVTRNPWDKSKTAGGSSGGSAAALATGQVWLATGSDLGGSVRTPAAYCSVVGLRPSPGVVPRRNLMAPHTPLSVIGPMARTVEDTALMLDAMAGQSAEDPLSRPLPAHSYLAQCRAAPKSLNIAWSPDLGLGLMDAEVAQICGRAIEQAGAKLNAPVSEACPDFRSSHFIFQTLRAIGFARSKHDVYAIHRDQLKPEIIWNIERGLALSIDEITAAERAQGKLHANVAAFFTQYDILATPTTLLPPFPVDWAYPEALGTHQFETYIDWLAPVYALSCVAIPVINIPVGFTAAGLPVGVQLAGRPHGDGALLGAARAFEKALNVSPKTPIDSHAQT